MKKINKMNINGEVYDIQDNSSGYITGEEVAKFLPNAYKIRYNLGRPNTAENIETVRNIINDIENQKNVTVLYEFNANEYAYLNHYEIRGEREIRFYFIYIETSGTTGVEDGLVRYRIINVYKITSYNIDNENASVHVSTTKTYSLENNANLSTKDYVDSKFAEALAMGFKVEVVEALPTENISHQVIYLMLNGDDEENNIYDEFIYNSNNEWEKIGSTKTDLSNYYNKQEVDELVAPIQDYEIVSIDCGEYGTDEIKKQRALKNASYLINKLFEDFNSALRGERKKIYIPYVTYHNSYYTSTFFAGKLITSLSNKPTSITFHGDFRLFPYGINTNEWNTGCNLTIYGTWENDVFTATNCNSSGYDMGKAITTSNTSKFFPTRDYHPVTRKYVDETTLYDWGANNVVIWASYQNYIAGQIIFKTDDLKYFICLEDHKSSYKFSSDTSKWKEITGEELEALKRPTKEYVDDAVANISVNETIVISNANRSNAEIIQAVDEAYQKYLNGESYSIILKHEVGDFLGIASAGGYFVEGPNKAFVRIQTMEIDSYNSSYVSPRYSLWVTLTITDNHVTALSSVQNKKTNWGLGGGDVLKTKNTSSFTPTEDYHPAHKLYVDTSISTALGDINTILATLTTVEEGE